MCLAEVLQALLLVRRGRALEHARLLGGGARFFLEVPKHWALFTGILEIRIIEYWDLYLVALNLDDLQVQYSSSLTRLYSSIVQRREYYKA